MRGKHRQAIVSLVERLLGERGGERPVVCAEAKIAELGLTSMAFAELVSELEQLLDVDPFDEELSITDIVTVGDLIAAYDRPGAT